MREKDKHINEKNTPKRWVACPLEDQYFGEDRKLDKSDRKRAQALDRSKYKKTDYQKRKSRLEETKGKRLEKDQLFRGRVLSITAKGIIVDFEKQEFLCQMRGSLKIEQGEEKNPIAVGDFVLFDKTEETQGVICHVEPRSSFLLRADNLSRKKAQVIAANIDQVIITVSVVNPPLKPFLVDRYIIAAAKGGMEAVIVVNKIDLLEERSESEEAAQYIEFLEGYRASGLRVISVSTQKNMGLDELFEAMKGKASVFSGQSGVGKSSLINAVTGLNLRTGTTVEKTKKGSHTTTSAHLIPLAEGGFCIDTPGIKSFGIWDVKKQDVQQYFDDIFLAGKKCRFADCSHIEEQACAVKEAVEKGEIPFIRYQSYLNLIASITVKHLRR